MRKPMITLPEGLCEEQNKVGLEAFKYQPLTDAARYIRLLQICPDKDGGPLYCKLSVSRLDQVPRYAAISYHWGIVPSAKRFKRTIWINGQAVGVHENCYYALSQVRHNLVHVHGLGLNYIWIDSICINQEDLMEKAAQIGIMASHVYPSAVWVFVCLGPSSSGSEELLEHLSVLDDQRQTPALALVGGHDTSSSYSAFLDIARRSYWTRLWIIPEILTAKKIQILCGTRMIHWRLLRKLLDNLRTQRKTNLSQTGIKEVSSTPFAKVCETKDTIGRRIGIRELESLLQKHSDWGCTEPRDRLFAFWSMIDWGQRVDGPPVCYEALPLDLARIILQLSATQSARHLSAVCSSICDLLVALCVSPYDLYSYRLATAIFPASLQAFMSPCEYIYVAVSRCRLATIKADRNGKMTVAKTTREGRMSGIQPNGGVACRPLFNGSSIFGWLCPAAKFGDLLMKFVLDKRKLYLVLRSLESSQGITYVVIGQAIVSQLCDIVPDTEVSTLSKYAVLRLAAFDLITLAAPSFIERYNGDRGRFSHYTRPASIWPACEFQPMVYTPPTEINGAGYPMRDCFTCTLRTGPCPVEACATCGSNSYRTKKLPCGHLICWGCLKSVFELSVETWEHMPPRCCTGQEIFLESLTGIVDSQFKSLWRRRYLEYMSIARPDR